MAKKTTPTAKAGVRTVTLSDGRVAEIRELLGKHALDAQKRSEGKSDEYQAILISQSVTIDGKAVVKEDVDNLPMKDFNAVYPVFVELNF